MYPCILLTCALTLFLLNKCICLVKYNVSSTHEIAIPL